MRRGIVAIRQLLPWLHKINDLTPDLRLLRERMILMRSSLESEHLTFSCASAGTPRQRLCAGVGVPLRPCDVGIGEPSPDVLFGADFMRQRYLCIDLETRVSGNELDPNVLIAHLY
jgi:hypothetical protein